MLEDPRPHPLADHLDDAFDDVALAATWTAIQRERAGRTTRRERVRIGAAFAAISIALVLVWASIRSAPLGPIARAGGGALTTVTAGETVVLDEGSRITLGGDAALDVLGNQPGALALHLRRGWARFEITPNGPRTWRIEGAGVAIEVVGTVFEVLRTEERVVVSVERGIVLVRGTRVPDGVRRVGAGESLDVPTGSLPVEPVPATDVVEAASAGGDDDASAEPRVRRRGMSARALLAEADALRRAGEHEAAIEVLRGIVNGHPRAHEAPLAAFTLARILSQRGEADEARRFYMRALALGLDGPLADDARAAIDDLEVP